MAVPAAPGAASRREKRRGGALSARALGLVVLACLAVVRVWDPFPIETMRLKMFDYFQRLAPRVSRPRGRARAQNTRTCAAMGVMPTSSTMIAR